MSGVLVGALLGLVAALIIQVIVIPRVQTRMCWCERWLDDANEFYSVSSTQLPLAIHGLRRLHTLQAVLLEAAIREWLDAIKPAATGWRLALPRKSKSAPRAGERGFRSDALEPVRAAIPGADDLVGQYVGRLQFLAFRLTARYRHSDRNPELHRLRSCVLDLRNLLKQATTQEIQAQGDAVQLDEKWRKNWDAVEAANAELADLAEPFALAVRPPSRRRSWKEKPAAPTKD